MPRLTIPVGGGMQPSSKNLEDPGRLALVLNMIPYAGGLRSVPDILDSAYSFQIDDDDSPNVDPEEANSAYVHTRYTLPPGLGANQHVDGQVFIMGEGLAASNRPVVWAASDDGLSGPDFYRIAGSDTSAVGNRNRFCSFGNQVIAVSESVGTQDPVWMIDFDDGTPAWAALITSTEQPAAAFCAVVRNQLVLANINNTGGSVADGPDFVWWSALNDASDFDPSQTTQCDFQKIVDIPGPITGLVGGDYGLIFKSRGIVRMDYVGAPAIYSLDTISSTIGCIEPESIVKVGDDVYFWSASGIMRLADGRSLTALPTDVLEGIQNGDFAFDVSLSNTTVYSSAFDDASQCIFWHISTSDFLLCYSIALEAFSLIDTSDFTYANSGESMSIIVSAHLGTGIFDSLGIVSYDDTTGGSETVSLRLLGDTTTLPGKIRTKVFRLSGGKNFQINRVRPVFSPAGVDNPGYILTEDGSLILLEDDMGAILMEGAAFDETDLPTVTVRVESSDNPWFTSTSVSTETTDSSRADNDYWMPLDRSNGEFFRITLDIAAFDSTDFSVRELVAIELEYQEMGSF